MKDARYSTLRETDRRMIYFPYSQDPAPHHLWEWGMCLAVRTTGPHGAMAARVRQELQDLDGSLPILRINTIEERLNELLVEERVLATLSGFFGVVAVLLVSVGLYGMISYTVARRTNEIGIRLALGSTRAGILAMALKESLLLVAGGIAIGATATLAAARLISSRLFGVSAADPFTIGAATLLMLAVATLAAFLPARRASRVDPMVALSCE